MRSRLSQDSGFLQDLQVEACSGRFERSTGALWTGTVPASSSNCVRRRPSDGGSGMRRRERGGFPVRWRHRLFRRRRRWTRPRARPPPSWPSSPAPAGPRPRSRASRVEREGPEQGPFPVERRILLIHEHRRRARSWTARGSPDWEPTPTTRRPDRSPEPGRPESSGCKPVRTGSPDPQTTRGSGVIGSRRPPPGASSSCSAG